MVEVEKKISSAPNSSLLRSIAHNSLKERQLSEAGGAHSNDAQLVGSFQEWHIFLMRCEELVALPSVPPQHYVLDLYKLLAYLFAQLYPP